MCLKGIYIGLDFDGTVVTHDYPNMGNEVPHCIDTLKQITDAGGKLILITMRSGRSLTEAVAYLNDHDIPLYGINNNPQQHLYSKSPKIYANIYIDDAALGCPLISSELSDNAYVDWLQVQLYFFPKNGQKPLQSVLMEVPVYDEIPVDPPKKVLNFFTDMFSRLGFE
ncbi:MAG: hypothetical protein ACRYFB_04455 [Janthinobacterium lividum]